MGNVFAERSTLATPGVDWITVTLPSRCTQSQAMKWKLLTTWLGRDRQDLQEPRPFSWMGYSGLQRASAAWGTRQDGQLVRVSGPEALEVLDRLPDSGWHCSRLDLCVTFWLDPPEPELAAWACGKALEAREKLPASRKRRVTLIVGCGDGDTLYIGSRKSLQFGRLYDKGAESEAAYYAGAWRAEVEYHDEAATKVAEAVKASQDWERDVYATAATWFASRGVEILRANSGTPIRFVGRPRVSGDDLHRLQWLATTVAPTVERLTRSVGFDLVAQAVYNGREFLESAGITAGLPEIRGTQHARNA